MFPSTDITTMRRMKDDLLLWFQKYGRVYPWRTTSNEFHILVAEMLLRRTTATAVSKVFPTLIKRYPTPINLARARESTLKKILTPLGLQSIRAVHLHRMANLLVKEHNGDVPNDFDSLLELPGVGQYVASAVQNFAFGEAVPMVDGNVLHLINRLFNLQFKDPIDKELWDIAHTFGGPDHPRQLYWGMIDLVSSVCLRRRPRCESCPLTETCLFYSQSNRQD